MWRTRSGLHSFIKSKHPHLASGEQELHGDNSVAGPCVFGHQHWSSIQENVPFAKENAELWRSQIY